MATAKENSGVGEFVSQLLTVEIYKRNQGRLVRQATFGAMAAMILLGCYRLYHTLLMDYSRGVKYSVLGSILVVGGWIIFRIVNLPRFANFLIAVEAEMVKVTWPNRDYLMRAAAVVLTVMVVLGAYIWGVDILWLEVFKRIGFLEITKQVK